MKLLGWVKLVLAVAAAIVIGLAVTGVVNLLAPVLTIGWALGAVLAASVLSALAGFLVAGGRNRPASAARSGKAAGEKDGVPEAEKR